MAFDMVKFERGQVWMVRFKHPQFAGREQEKDRPHVVLSIGKFNTSSGMVTMAPITTREEVRTPSQVGFINHYNRKNVVLCEHIRTLDHTCGEYLFEFMGVLSDEIMEKIDVALSIHLGMHYSPITLKSLYDTMEGIVKSVGYMQEKAGTPKFTDEDVQKFTEKLREISETALGSIITDTEGNKEIVTTNTDIPTIIVTNEEVAATKEEVSEEQPKVSWIKPELKVEETIAPKKPRMKWTREKCKEFLNDMNTLPMKEVMKKWDVEKKAKLYPMKAYAMKLMEGFEKKD